MESICRTTKVIAFAAPDTRGLRYKGQIKQTPERHLILGGYAVVAPRPRNYAERLCNPQAMLHNRRAWSYRSHATPRSCHKHCHSYQCIIERSRLVEQLAHHRLYDTKDHIATHIARKIAKIHNRGHRPNITTCGSEFSCLTTRSKLWPKRPIINKILASLFRDVPSCHLGTPDYSSMSTKNPPSCSVTSSSETNNNQQRETEYDVLASLVGLYRPKDDKALKLYSGYFA